MSDALVVERSEGVVTVWFNRPEALNAFTPEMSLEFGALLGQLREDEDARAVVFTGKGRAFSAGADLKSLSSPDRLGRPADVGTARVRAAGLRTEELLELPKPTIAAVNGAVAGFALGLVLACDVVLAGESARFGVTFSRLGYVPDGGVSWLLTRIVGLSRAKELFFAGETIDAAEAERIGLVSHVVPDDRLVETAIALARKFAARPRTAIRMGKTLLNRAAVADFRTAIELEAEAQGILGTTDEHREALKAWRRS